jgi:transketolase C-terminal domain/subunit
LESLVGAGIFPPKMKLMGVNDQFGQSGTTEELLDAYGLTWEHIITAYNQL